VTGVESPRAGLATTGVPGRLAPGGGPAANGRPAANGAGASWDAPTLSDRLTALARMTQIGFARSGQDGFSPQLLRDTETLLGRAGERLRMSADHTVVVLAGGTGSGKSSLFNQLAGADFSPVGVIRPMTREAYACVWGMDGATPLLDWLGVRDRNRYARSSALGEGERSLGGLLLLDLPDHDSVLSGESGSVNRLVSLADLMVWVLDPQKYADAAVHSRYLMPMAGHSSVIAVVLNQADLLTTEQAGDCVIDLQRLLDAEGLHDSRILVTSAVTGAGLDDLREVLAKAVTARRASAERLSADVDALAARFAPYAGEAGTVGAGDGEEALAEAFAQAAGVAGVARTLQSARELKAADYVGWPVSWLADRLLRRDPVRKIRLGTLWDELRGVSAGPAGAHRAEIDNAITVLADKVAPGLPAPWPATARAAARSQVDAIPAALGEAVGAALPAENSAAGWWRLVAAWQGLLLGAAVAGLAWLVTLLVAGVFQAARHPVTLFSNVHLMPWVAVMVVAILALGWLTAIGCMSLVDRTADRERERAERQMRSGIAEVGHRLVVLPVEQELAIYTQFRDELAVARGA
jgi:GTP-binding protein EngB required for normal cell division